MSASRVSSFLVDVYQLIDFSEKLLDDIENQPLSELPRIVALLRKNLRDAKSLVNDAEKEFDSMIKEIDKAEEFEVVI